MDYNFNKSSYTIALVLFSLLSFNAFAQKEPQYTQYMYNIGSFNPAYVGTVETPELEPTYLLKMKK